MTTLKELGIGNSEIRKIKKARGELDKPKQTTKPRQYVMDTEEVRKLYMRWI